MIETQTGGMIKINGILEYRDADGNVIERVPVSTELPIEALEPRGDDDGLDIRQ